MKRARGAYRRAPSSNQPCHFIAREIDRSQIPCIPVRAPSKRALDLSVYSFSKGLKKDNHASERNLYLHLVLYLYISIYVYIYISIHIYTYTS